MRAPRSSLTGEALGLRHGRGFAQNWKHRNSVVPPIESTPARAAKPNATAQGKLMRQRSQGSGPGCTRPSAGSYFAMICCVFGMPQTMQYRNSEPNKLPCELQGLDARRGQREPGPVQPGHAGQELQGAVQRSSAEEHEADASAEIGQQHIGNVDQRAVRLGTLAAENPPGVIDRRYRPRAASRRQETASPRRATPRRGSS